MARQFPMIRLEEGGEASGEAREIIGKGGAQAAAIGTGQQARIDDGVQDRRQQLDELGEKLLRGLVGWWGGGFGHAIITAR